MQNPDQEAILFGDLWRIQESLLQAYRIIFIIVESILLSAATVLLATHHAFVLIGLPLLLLGLGLIPVWMGVCRARANAVAFIHWLIQKYEAGDEIVKPYTHFRQFQKDRTCQGQNLLQDERYLSLCKSKTRKRMDVVVPLLFFSNWILLLFIALLAQPG